MVWQLHNITLVLPHLRMHIDRYLERDMTDYMTSLPLTKHISYRAIRNANR